MPGGIVYLDVDDEITSAAARIRDVAERRVALVLPYGSRVATSRINFRLLSRDALVNEKQLAVVAVDSATRALAASAGLPVFASVGEYESSIPGRAADGAEPPAVGAEPSAVGAASGAGPATPTGAVPSQPASGSTPSSPTPSPAKRTRRRQAAKAGEDGQATEPDPPPKATQAIPLDDVRHIAPRAQPASTVGDETVQVAIPWVPMPPTDRPWRADSGPAAPPIDQGAQRRTSSGRASRLPLVIVLAALGLVVLVGSVAAYVVLPSVSIVVTPRVEAIALPAITVTADPTATEPDAATRVVPADIVPLEVTVSDVFPATGKRIEEEIANGAVRFANLDFLRSNRIPAGSIVSTNAGVRFRTVKEVTVPRADLVGLTVFPGRITVDVTAVEPGTAGNVEPNTVVIIPKGKDPESLKVVNPDATSGGTHEEFPQVAQEDVDGAIEQLTSALIVAFEARLADPSIAPPEATVFAETASLGDPTPSVDPESLVGQEVETFEIGLTATGTVLTVKQAPVRAIADELIRATVEPGHQLVAGSIHVDVSRLPGDDVIAFSATATGEQIAALDAEELRALVIGKTLDDAQAALAPFGDVELTAWPDWVSSVPTIEDRVELRIGEGAPVEAPAASETAS